VFLECSETEGAYNKQRDVSFADNADFLIQTTGYTRIMKVQIILYGNDAYGNSQKIRDGMFNPIYKMQLALQNIYIIPNIAAPKRSPELLNELWWNRTDMTLEFNELVIRQTDVPFVESTEAIIYTEAGLVSDDVIE
jgi:hypothetical protein